VITKEDVLLIMKSVGNGKGVSVGEILNRLEGGRGDHIIVIESGNVAIGAGMSEALCKVMGELLGRLIKPKASDILVMAYDGSPIPDMPIAKNPPAGGYKETHFAPCVFDVVDQS
jgi:hypothetical protein